MSILTESTTGSEIWEGDEHRRCQFSESGSPLTGPNLFSQLPLPCHSLPEHSFTECFALFQWEEDSLLHIISLLGRPGCIFGLTEELGWRVQTLSPKTGHAILRSRFWEGDATKHFSVKRKGFSVKGGGHSVNEGFGKDFYRKGSSVKRSGPFNEAPDPKLKSCCLHPLPENQLLMPAGSAREPASSESAAPRTCLILGPSSSQLHTWQYAAAEHYLAVLSSFLMHRLTLKADETSILDEAVTWVRKQLFQHKLFLPPPKCPVTPRVGPPDKSFQVPHLHCRENAEKGPT